MQRCCSLVLTFLISSYVNPRHASTAETQNLQKLTIGYPALATTIATIAVIQKGGFFRKHGLDVDLVYISGSPLLTAAMVSGQVPLTFIGAPAVVASAVGGNADTVLLSCAISMAYGKLFAVPEIKNLSQLKGKKVGITRIGAIDDAVSYVICLSSAQTFLTAKSLSFLPEEPMERLIALTRV